MTSSSPEKVPVWDSDAHICEPRSVWERYAAPEYRGLVMQAHTRPDGTETTLAGGDDLGMSAAPACIPGVYGNPNASWDDILPGSYDPVERLKVMDAEGLDHAVCFPSIYLISGDITDPDAAVANARAYNDWMADFVSADRERLYGIAVCPLQDPRRAAEEIDRAAGLGLVGLTFRPERYDGLELFADEMDRVWSVAEANDLTVAVHGSFGSRMPSFARTRYRNQFYVHMVCHPFEQMACVMEIVASGVLDRHPQLRVGFFESGLGWLPYWLERLDEHKESMGHLVPTLKREPTEIWSEQCFVTMEAGEGDALAQLDDMGLGHTVVWGSDYPHYDCTYPGALVELEETFERLDRPGLREKVLNHNAHRFLGLPA